MQFHPVALFPVYGIIVNAIPAAIGIVRLSSIGKGRHPTNIPVAAPKNALTGLTKNRAPISANRKPKAKPSTCFPLLKGNRVLPNFLPKIVSKLSPRVNIATDA